jgi:hypothetical protein
MDFHIEDLIEKELLTKALKATKSYEYWDHSALLGCAVWKAQCLLQMLEINGFFVQQEWHTLGWKTCKTEQRDSVAISEVVALVRPFLDPLKVDSCSENVTASSSSVRLSSRREALSVLLRSRSSDEIVAESTHFRFGEAIGMYQDKHCALCNLVAPDRH